MKNTNTFGPHLMLDLHQCNRRKLRNFELIYDFLKEMPAKIGMTRISEPKVMKYKDRWARTPGVTGFVILAESHVSIHTFPDDDFVFIDIFSCRNFDYNATKEYLIRFFESKSPKTHLVKRGQEFAKRPVIEKKVTAEVYA